MNDATTIESLRSALATAETHAAAAQACYEAYMATVDADDYDAGEHVIDYSVAADEAVEAAREALAEAVRESIEVGSVDEVYPRYEDGEEVDLADMTGDLAYYVHVPVWIDGEEYSVACSVWIMPWEQGSARASGAMTSYGGGPKVWWEDSSDWEGLPADLVDAVKNALSEAARELLSEAEEICEEAREERQVKSNVSRGNWETVASYVSTFSDGDDEGAADVEVQVGEAHGAWFVRTTDVAGGSDDADDTRYETEDEAREAAEDFAWEHNDANPGEDAESYLARQLEDRAGEPASDGEWCVYWETSGDDEHMVDRYATREQAEAAAELANDELHKRHSGHLLCGYDVRRLVDGEWVRLDAEDDAA